MKVLWFIAGVATAAQVKFAKANALTIRNSEAHSDGDFVEKCDEVCGDVPKAYAKHKVSAKVDEFKKGVDAAAKAAAEAEAKAKKEAEAQAKAEAEAAKK